MVMAAGMAEATTVAGTATGACTGAGTSAVIAAGVMPITAITAGDRHAVQLDSAGGMIVRTSSRGNFRMTGNATPPHPQLLPAAVSLPSAAPAFIYPSRTV